MSVTSYRRELTSYKRSETSHNLRPQNIIVVEYIIDFDWAGKQGEATYPLTLNVTSENNWAQCVMPAVMPPITGYTPPLTG